MEDKPQEGNATAQPQSNGAGDVQPLGAAAPATPAQPTPEVAPTVTSPATAPIASPPSGVASIPATQPESSGVHSLAQVQPEVPNTVSANPAQTVSTQEPNKNGHKRVIMIALAVALILSGVAVFAYMATQGENKQKDENHTDTSQHSQESDDTDKQEAQPATTHDVEDMAKELDEAASDRDESQELPDGGLEDTTGL